MAECGLKEARESATGLVRAGVADGCVGAMGGLPQSGKHGYKSDYETGRP